MSTTTQVDSDEQLVAGAVRELSRRTRFPVAFGGLVESGVVAVTSIVGNRTHRLAGLRVRPDRGLGGRAMTELRPRMTSNYRTSQQITHDYDGFVLGEGLRTLLAVPVIVGGRPRGVLYAGAWEASQVGDISTAPAITVAQALGAELRIRDEVERRTRALLSSVELAPSHREQLRESFAELRSIASAVTDTDLRERLAGVERRLVDMTGESLPTTTAPIPTVHLSRRELDVLSCVAYGATNAEIAAQLGLREGTVKAYLGTAMSKLDASTRHSAVVRARRINLLP